MKKRRFKVILEWVANEKVFTVEIPALPGCATYGSTREEALERAHEAISVTIEGLQATGQPIPDGDVDITSPIV
ncbi:MAG TPA: type II toxin-antitoxin system HicB family antitoxin [Desulfotomaculum sp.]|nr:MAG: antitoxin HicB [Desulfotomaculum sp. BICA1-6]HBX22966.1 type II toxin-antitoxin system HicB family antitoxin [Desulfotomaculum sp.]